MPLKLQLEVLQFLLGDDWDKYCEFMADRPLKRLRGGPKDLRSWGSIVQRMKKSIKRFQKYRKDL